MVSVWDKGVSGARRRLQVARDAFRMHAEECALWDYESDNGCSECHDTREAIREAREALARMQAKAL